MKGKAERWRDYQKHWEKPSGAPVPTISTGKSIPHLEKLKVSAALQVEIVTTKPKAGSTPNWMHWTLNTKIQTEEACSFAGVNAIYLSLYCSSTHSVWQSTKHYNTHIKHASKEGKKQQKKKKKDSSSSDKTICRIRLNNDADVRAIRQGPHD